MISEKRRFCAIRPTRRFGGGLFQWSPRARSGIALAPWDRHVEAERLYSPFIPQTTPIRLLSPLCVPSSPSASPLLCLVNLPAQGVLFDSCQLSESAPQSLCLQSHCNPTAISGRTFHGTITLVITTDVFSVCHLIVR